MAKRSPRRFVLMPLVLLCAATGCNSRQDADDGPALRPDVDGPVGVRIAAIEKTLDAKGYTLPGAVKGLVRDLKELRRDFTGDAAALDAVIRKLEDWHLRSNTRKTDSDQDRDEVRQILEELKTLMKPPVADDRTKTP